MPQFLRQMKGLMKIHDRGKFHIYSICGSQVIKFQMFSWRCSIHEMGHFFGVGGGGVGGGWGGFWGHNFPKICNILLKFEPEVEFQETKTVYEQFLKLCV